MCFQHFSRNIALGLSIISGLLQLLKANLGHVDGTLIPGFNGENVVIAVLEKIDASEVFENSEWFQVDRSNAKSFLRLMAYVESTDGRDGSGGIWNNIISEEELRKTQIYVNRLTNYRGTPVETLRNKILNSPFLGFDWMDTTMNNLSIPLYSGLATMIRLDKLFNDYNFTRLSNNYTSQAELWKTHFNGTGDAFDRWNLAVNQLITNKGKLILVRIAVYSFP